MDKIRIEKLKNYIAFMALIMEIVGFVIIENHRICAVALMVFAMLTVFLATREDMKE